MSAVISSLLVLDVIVAHELTDTLVKTLLVIGIITAAMLLLLGVLRFGMGPRTERAEQSAPQRPA